MDFEKQVLMKSTTQSLTGFERLEYIEKQVSNGKQLSGLVVFVHGTFAATEFDFHLKEQQQLNPQHAEPDAADTKARWWHANGSFASQFRKNGIEVLPFQWTGANLETDRSAAAEKLSEVIKRIEQLGVNYSIVAHSHGGNVVWSCFKRLARSKTKLVRLKSWVSVGTPFFQYKLSRFRAIVFGVFLGLVAPLYVGFAASPFIFAAWYWGWLSQNAVEIVAALAGYLCCCLFTVPIFGYACFKDTLPGHGRLNTRAIKEFGERHIAIWSDDDEAIRMLMASLHGTGEFVQRSDPGGIISDLIVKPVRDCLAAEGWIGARLLSAAFAVAFFLSTTTLLVSISLLRNLIVAPFVESYVNKQIKRSSHGLAGDFVRVVRVSSHPSGHYPESSLEERYAIEMADAIGSRNRELAEQIRFLIYNISISGIAAVGDLGGNATSRHLIHNFYFEHEPTIELIGKTVATSLSDKQN